MLSACLPSTGTEATDMLFEHWFPSHVGVSMVPVMSHGAVQMQRVHIRVTNEYEHNVRYCDRFAHICIYCIYGFLSFYLLFVFFLCDRGPHRYMYTR